MDNIKEEDAARMSWEPYNYEVELVKAKKALKEALYKLEHEGVEAINVEEDEKEHTLYEDGFSLDYFQIDKGGMLDVIKSDDNSNKFNAFDLKVIDNLEELTELVENALANYENYEGNDSSDHELSEDLNDFFDKNIEEGAELSDFEEARIEGTEDTCDCDNIEMEGCMESGPCQAGDDIPDVYDCLTDDMFPAEATEKDKYNKYVRRTPWTEIESYNKNNKKVVDHYIKYFRENFPEKAEGKSDIDILAENDDIWEKGLYDDILLTSLKNGDYVLDTYSDDCYVKGGLKGKDRHDVLANFDVVIDCTLVGYVCRPYIVFGISKQHSWMAHAVDDDYTREELKKISDLSGPKNDEELHWWRTEGVYKYHEREIELYKEGHVHFEIQDLGTEYRQYIRKVDHKAEKHKVTHDIW